MLTNETKELIENNMAIAEPIADAIGDLLVGQTMAVGIEALAMVTAALIDQFTTDSNKKEKVAAIFVQRLTSTLAEIAD